MKDMLRRTDCRGSSDVGDGMTRIGISSQSYVLAFLRKATMTHDTPCHTNLIPRAAACRRQRYPGLNGLRSASVGAERVPLARSASYQRVIQSSLEEQEQMGLYHIQYTPLAAEDIDEIDVYISETLCNPDAAEKLLTKMEQQIQRLQRYPHLGYIADDPYLAAKGYRKLVADNYLVFHLVNDANQTILIMRVLYGAREYRDLL